MFPPMGSFSTMVGPQMHMVYIDVGEIFYNLQIYLVMAKYCRVDLKNYLRHKMVQQGRILWIIWLRLMRGLVLSPYADIQGLPWESEMVRGDRSDPDNLFRWDNTRLNLHRDLKYYSKVSGIKTF